MADQPGLLAYWLNAEQALHGGIPDLLTGESDNGTATTAPNQSYHGPIARWDTLNASVRKFLQDQDILKHFDRCKQLPVYPDPKVEKINPHASTREHVQVGTVASLSMRFYERALLPVITSVKTLTSSEFGATDTAKFLPDQPAFEIAKEDQRSGNDPAGMKLPDVIAKLQVNGEDQVRLVGQFQLCTTVDLKKIVDDATDPKNPQPKAFSNILGPVYNYMMTNGTKYAFLTNYRWTIFLRLDDSKPVLPGDGPCPVQLRALYTLFGRIPCLHFSDPIQFSDTTDDTRRTISVRSALFYLIHRVGTPAADWEIHRSDRTRLLKQYIATNTDRVSIMLAPYSRSSRLEN